MVRIIEIGRVAELAAFRQPWFDLLRQTPGASFFQSLEWLEVYWRHFGAGQRLRALVALDGDRPTGIVPLVVRSERSRVGQVRVLTFPLHDWGAFYGPIGPNGAETLAACLEHIRDTPRDWDILELRWQGAVETDPAEARRAMIAAGFQAYPTVWDRTSVADLTGTWDAYWAARKGAWLRRRGELSYVRYRPAGAAHGDGSPRWDLYDACEELARQSWQGEARDGTTLSHESVRGFLRELHETAAAAGAADVNLLLSAGVPVAFIYGYHYRGYVFGLRRGYNARLAPQGAGNVLLARTLCDSFARGDRIYDMGVGSLASKRHFETRQIPILRYSHFPPLALRAQLLRLRRWWQARRLPASIAVGSAQDGAADRR
jgi:CelD/BcsL family acetyltransferase involved in cellulose biosynthesis